jgi:hypothetical protein
MPAPSHERATLSRALADFLVELSIALHKHAMYPQGHPSLQPAVTALTRRAELLLEDRATLSLGVARHQLVIEGVATDPKHPVLRELAGRLHRHHLGAVTFRRGVEASEVADALKVLAVEADRTGRPLGLEGAERLNAWRHVQLHPLTYERLELAEEGGKPAEGDARAAQLWVGLARAALATAPDAATPTEPAVIAQAINARATSGGDAAYDQVIVGYLLQIAAELKTAGGTEAAALRRRTSRLIRTLKPDTLQRLVLMGGDFTQRRQFVADVTDGMAVDAVLDILTAAAETTQETISHSLVRLLSKLAAHAETGAEAVRPQADAALREQVRRLLDGWTLPDPNPGEYGVALQRMARSAPVATPARSDAHPMEPDRIVAMALEIGTVGPRLDPAVDQVVSEGRLEQLLDALDTVTVENAASGVVRGRVATVDVVRRIANREPVDFKTLERVVPLVGPPAAAPLLDVLATAESRGTRRGLLAQLVKMGTAIAPTVIARLEDPRWYVTRNLLTLLESIGVPQGFSAVRFMHHADARVRLQAVKLQLKLPEGRDEALAVGLADQDPRTLRLALGLAVALQRSPDRAVPLLISRATDRALPTDLRVLAIRALGHASTPAALETLLQLTSAGRTLFGREKLPPKSLELLVALAALVTGWQQNPRVRARLARAAASGDREIRHAADPGGHP